MASPDKPLPEPETSDPPVIPAEESVLDEDCEDDYEDEEEYDDEEEDGDVSGLDINDLEEGYDLSALLTSEEGETIPSVLENIGEVLGGIENQMKITNKILVKLLSKQG
jgi:hypothetical protein